MALARAQAADEFMQKWLKRKLPKVANNSAGSPMKVSDSIGVDVDATSTSSMDTTDHECDSDCEQNEGDDQDENASADEYKSEEDDSEALDCSSLDPDQGLPEFHRWPLTATDARISARKMRDKLMQLALERKQRQGSTGNSKVQDAAASITASCDLDPFASVTTSGFDFARSLDSTGGAGSVGVMVEEDSFSAARFGATNRNAYQTYQM